MEFNLLEVRNQTIVNYGVAISGLKSLYVNDGYECVLDEEYIRIKFLGKSISIPYYTEVFGKMVNEKEYVEKSFNVTPIYEKVEINPLTTDEIKDLIISGFSKGNMSWKVIRAE